MKDHDLSDQYNNTFESSKVFISRKIIKVLEILKESGFGTNDQIYFLHNRFNHCFIGKEIIDWCCDHGNKLFDEYNKSNERNKSKIAISELGIIFEIKNKNYIPSSKNDVEKEFIEYNKINAKNQNDMENRSSLCEKLSQRKNNIPNIESIKASNCPLIFL